MSLPTFLDLETAYQSAIDRLSLGHPESFVKAHEMPKESMSQTVLTGLCFPNKNPKPLERDSTLCPQHITTPNQGKNSIGGLHILPRTFGKAPRLNFIAGDAKQLGSALTNQLSHGFNDVLIEKGTFDRGGELDLRDRLSLYRTKYPKSQLYLILSEEFYDHLDNVYARNPFENNDVTIVRESLDYNQKTTLRKSLEGKHGYVYGILPIDMVEVSHSVRYDWSFNKIPRYWQCHLVCQFDVQIKVPEKLDPAMMNPVVGKSGRMREIDIDW